MKIEYSFPQSATTGMTPATAQKLLQFNNIKISHCVVEKRYYFLANIKKVPSLAYLYVVEAGTTFTARLDVFLEKCFYDEVLTAYQVEMVKEKSLLVHMKESIIARKLVDLGIQQSLRCVHECTIETIDATLELGVHNNKVYVHKLWLPDGQMSFMLTVHANDKENAKKALQTICDNNGVRSCRFKNQSEQFFENYFTAMQLKHSK